MDIQLDLIDRISQGPAWVYWWTRVIDASNWLLLPFAFFDQRARIAFSAWLANIVMIIALYNIYGYTRILGLSHILAWTPLLFYLLSKRKSFLQENLAGRYLYWFMGVIGVSLLFDYLDLIRFLAGDTLYAL